ncbi:MAG: hypothetical protein II164_04765 [Firmicutes bacterium]|nr:hypothetical protein [Bacillota bacterium]MBQ2042723.1 hypothetical protein [Bacillota bacterium]
MKKKMAALLALVMVLSLVLCSCGGGGGNNNGGNNTGSLDYYFEVKGVKVEMKADAEAVLKALGSYKSSYEAPSCAFDGMDKIYSYGGYDILTYTADGKDFISGVVLRDDTVETPEGIAIGSKLEDVKKKYNAKEEGSSINVYSENCRLLIIFDNGVVSSIQYIARSEK